jgi:protein subunit release factor A
MARTARARALGGELLGLYDEVKGLQEVVNDMKEDAGTREAFQAEADEVQKRIQYLQSELIIELLPRDVDDELGVVRVAPPFEHVCVICSCKSKARDYG